jgi:hypothetical protein
METLTPRIAIMQNKAKLPTIEPVAMSLRQPQAVGKTFNPLTLAYLNLVSWQQTHAPVFNSPPSQTGTLYSCVNGGTYFIPNAVVSMRMKGSTTPDVFIQRKADGDSGDVGYTLRVTFELRRPDNLPDSAHPLPLDQFSISLQPGTGQAIPFPSQSITVLPAPDGADPDVVQKLAVEAPVDVDQMINILQNDAQAHFVLEATVHYQLHTDPNQPPPLPHPIRYVPIYRPLNGVVTPVTTTTPLTVNPQLMRIRRFNPSPQVMRPITIEPPTPPPPPPVASASGSHSSFLSGLGKLVKTAIETSVNNSNTNSTNSTSNGDPNKKLDLSTLTQFLFNPTSVTTTNSDPNTHPAQSIVSLELTNTSTSGLGAYFPKTLPKNRPIYAGVDGTYSDNPDAVWVTSNLGYFKESAVPNQFYILPDGYSLSLNIEKSVPDMSVLMTPNADPNATGADAYKIRVSFSIAPWVDAGRKRDMRAYLSSQLGIVYPDLVLGGYTGGTFEPTHLFDQLGSTALTGATGTNGAPAVQSIDPSQPFEFILDCTLEFYTLLSKLLVSTDGQGLKGNVHIQLKTDSTANATPSDVVVPVCLRLDQVANHPLISGLVAMPSSPDPSDKSDSSDEGTMNPAQMMVSNPSQLSVTVETVISTLLLTQDDLPPVSATVATSNPASLNLGPNGVVTIILTAPPKTSAWTSVAVDYDGIAVKLDATQVLNQIHQMASSSSFKTNLNITCYALAHPESLPPDLSTIIGIHVQIQNTGASSVVTDGSSTATATANNQPQAVTQDVHVTRDQPNPTVSLAYSLTDVLNGASLDQPKCRYRCRNMTALGETGNWSDWQDNLGQDLFVAPVSTT